ARETFAPAIDELEAAGVDRARIAHLAVFTTDDPTAETFAIADATKRSFPAPKADPAKWADNGSSAVFDEYTGEYGPSPNYQQGVIPFAQFGDGGNFEFKDGVPTVAD